MMNAALKMVMLDDRNEFMFSQPVMPETYNDYTYNMGRILHMVQSQSLGFWIRFVITFRSHMYKMGFVPRHDLRFLYAEECFVSILELITNENKNLRVQHFKQLMEDIRTFYAYNYCAGEVQIPVNLLNMAPKCRNSLKRLMGDPKDVMKKWHLFYLWTRFGGSVVMYYDQWRMAKEVASLKDIPWNAPIQWYRHNKKHRAHYFEKHLKEKWGKSLLKIVEFSQPTIAWWDFVEGTASVIFRGLSDDYPQLTSIPETFPLYPLSDDETEDFVEHFETMNLNTGTPGIKIPGSIRKCWCCNRHESNTNSLKTCKKCIEEHLEPKMLYCDKECQRKH